MVMKTKIITALVAFFATFIFSVGLALYFTPIDTNQVTAFKLVKTDKRSAQKIFNVLRQDINNGSERRESYSNADEAQSVAEYANKSGQLDVEGLPADFQNAWLKHMIAWHNYADFLKDLENPKLKKNYEEDQISRIAAEHNSKINTTWYQVLRTAKSYGAEIPANAY
jgi:hypothetical protein